MPIASKTRFSSSRDSLVPFSVVIDRAVLPQQALALRILARKVLWVIYIRPLSMMALAGVGRTSAWQQPQRAFLWCFAGCRCACGAQGQASEGSVLHRRWKARILVRRRWGSRGWHRWPRA